MLSLKSCQRLDMLIILIAISDFPYILKEMTIAYGLMQNKRWNHRASNGSNDAWCSVNKEPSTTLSVHLIPDCISQWRRLTLRIGGRQFAQFLRFVGGTYPSQVRKYGRV